MSKSIASASVIAARLLALGAAVFSASELLSVLAARGETAPIVIVTITNAMMLVASSVMLASPRRASVVAVFAATCLASSILAAWSALPMASEPTSWVPVLEMLALSAAGVLHRSRLVSTQYELSLSLAAMALGAMLALFGIVHLLNVGAIGGMIPGWIPFRSVLPIVTGSILVGAAVAMIFKRSRALASIVIATMFASWIAVLHLPRLSARPDDLGEWTFAAMALALTGALLVFASADRSSGGLTSIESIRTRSHRFAKREPDAG